MKKRIMCTAKIRIVLIETKVFNGETKVINGEISRGP